MCERERTTFVAASKPAECLRRTSKKMSLLFPAKARLISLTAESSTDSAKQDDIYRAEIQAITRDNNIEDRRCKLVSFEVSVDTHDTCKVKGGQHPLFKISNLVSSNWE